MKSLSEALETIAKGLIIWLQALIAPAQSILSTLAIEEREKRNAKLVTIWIWSLRIGIPFQVPLLRLFGIDLTDIGYILPNILITSLAMFFVFFFSHLSLRLFRVPSRMYDLFSIYVLTVVVYSPISVLALLPNAATTFSMIRKLKATSHSLDDAIQGAFKVFLEATQSEFALATISAVVLPISSIFGICALAIFGECIVQIYNSSRFKVLLASTLGSILGDANSNCHDNAIERLAYVVVYKITANLGMPAPPDESENPCRRDLSQPPKRPGRSVRSWRYGVWLLGSAGA